MKRLPIAIILSLLGNSVEAFAEDCAVGVTDRPQRDLNSCLVISNGCDESVTVRVYSRLNGRARPLSYDIDAGRSEEICPTSEGEVMTPGGYCKAYDRATYQCRFDD